MLTTLVVATALLRGLPPTYVVMLALSAWAPWAALAAISLTWIRERAKPVADAEVAFLASLTSHLDAGQSLRQAIALAAESVPTLALEPAVRSARAGLPIEDCAVQIADALPTQGRSVASALTLAARTGGGASAVFEMLTGRAATELDLRRELRSGTAGARFSALMLGGGPLALLAVQARSTSLTGPTAVVVLVGSVLIVIGSVTTWAMVKKAVG